MTEDLNPRWKSTEDKAPARPGGGLAGRQDEQFWSEDTAGEAGLFDAAQERLFEKSEEGKQAAFRPPPPQRHRVHIAQEKCTPILLGGVAILFLAVFGFLFLRGVSRIRADLVEELVPDLEVQVTENGFSPSEAEIATGKLVEWKNTGKSPQQFQSDQRNLAGAPFISSPLLPPDGTYRLKITEDLEDATVTLRSTFLPTMTGMLRIIAAAPVAMELPSSASAPPPAPQAPETVSMPAPLPAFPSPPAMPAPVQPSPVPSPAAPPSAVSPSKASDVGPQTIEVGDAMQMPVVSSWPSLLRINRYTVGSPLVPLAPTDQFPVHSVARANEAYTSSRSRPPARPYDAAGRARRQPETGPALWIFGALTLCAMPFVCRRRRAAS